MINMGEKLSFFKGTLGEEWNLKNIPCDVKIYSKGIKIEYYLPDGTYCCPSYSFSSIDKQKSIKKLKKRRNYL
ncbi:UNVERIFIED_CONTAM: hypothetical protein Cloal_0444 [Acetivibrio alkalicellulosi]